MNMKSDNLRLIVGATALIACIVMEYVLKTNEMIILGTALVGYAIIAYDVIRETCENMTHGRIFDEETLMTVATVGAFFVGAYSEAIGVMLFFKIGEIIEDAAVGKSRGSVRSLMDLQPDTANLIKDGEVITVASKELSVGDTVLIRAGDRVPADGTVTEGYTSLDTKSLTGESVPRDVSPGDTVLSGCINLTGAVKVRIDKEAGASTASRIIELMEDAESKKSRSEKFITVFSRYYTPAVFLIAILVAVIPPIFLGENLSVWVYRALTILVISCPCALVISVPLAFFCGIGKASSEGVLIKGSDSIETMSKVKTAVMDKTGTLTKGVFAISGVYPVGISENELIDITATAEEFSDHPMSKPFRNIEVNDHCVSSIEEIPGMGLKAEIDSKTVCVGNMKLMELYGLEIEEEKVPGVPIYVCIDGVYVGHIVMEDQLKETSIEAVSQLKHEGVKTVMLTGDREHVGRMVAEKIGIDEVHADMLPGDKLEKMGGYLDPEGKKKLMFVGDGINDAPSLARSDVGVAMGGIGSDAAIEAADVVIMSDEPSKIPFAIDLSKKVMRTVWVNVIAALAVKFGFMILAMSGLIMMWAGVFADVGMMLILVLNSVRILGKGSFSNLLHAEVNEDECECGCKCCCH